MSQFVSGPPALFWPFHGIRDYARTLEAGQSRHRHRLARDLDLATRLERALVPQPIVFGHNDLLPANILDDGERLWLIDFEYAAYSTPGFDLAGLASNAEFTPAESEALLSAYFARPPDEALMRGHSAMCCASLLREVMWSMVCELHPLAVGVDYAQYTVENLVRLDGAVADHAARFGVL